MNQCRRKDPCVAACSASAILFAFLTMVYSPAEAETPNPVRDALAAMRAEASDPTESAEEAAEPTPEPQTSSSSGAAGSKLQIHGYLTQAYAESSFAEGGFLTPSIDEVIVGIPEDGTTDYRNVAIQFRYALTPRDITVIQLSHRALGISPIRLIEDEVELDWAFYERRIGDSSSVKIGRVPIPIGIFNEIRDVGTILPFFRPPFFFYREASFTSETVDGILFGHTFWSEKETTLHLDLYYGGFTTAETLDPNIGFFPPGFDYDSIFLARAEDLYGVQLWLNTAVPGLRFGAGGSHRNQQGGLIPAPGTKISWEDYHASIDASFNKIIFRTEFLHRQFPTTGLFVPFDVENDTFYAQLGIHATEKWRFYFQYDQADSKLLSPFFVQTVEFTNLVDFAVALNYAFSPNLVFKLEWHDQERDQQVPVSPPGQPVAFAVVTTTGGEQFIASFAASF